MKQVTVKLQQSPGDERIVGVPAQQDRRIYSEYDDRFLETRLRLSPFKLHAETGEWSLAPAYDLTYSPSSR